MGHKIIINTERCKGCGLCVEACPKALIVVSEESNRNGYFPAEARGVGCTGCTLCAIMCPEAIIEVFREVKVKVDALPIREIRVANRRAFSKEKT